MKTSKHGRMDYIGNKAVFAAVMFARKMIRTGTPAGLAIHRAAKYYSVQPQEVAKYVGQHASRTKAARSGGAC